MSNPSNTSAPATAKSKPFFSGLILLTGLDTPGVTRDLFATLGEFNVEVVDIEQVVIRGRLILTSLIKIDPAHAEAIEADLVALSERLGLDLAVDFSDHPPLPNDENRVQLHVVALSSVLKPEAITAIAARISSFGGNIDRIRRTASYPLMAIEFDVSLRGSDSTDQAVQALRRELSEVAKSVSVDLGVEPGGLIRRAKRIVMMDMDSTLIQQEVIDLLAERAGVGDKVKEITDRAMRGELDFRQSLEQRLGLLQGLPIEILGEVASEIRLTPGARTLIRTLHALGHKVGVVSGGFINVIEPLLRELRVDFFRANELEIVDGKLTGALVGPVIDRAAKAAALREFAGSEGVALGQTIAIGDGANDLDMIEIAGLGIAFNAKPNVQSAADSALNSPYLDSVLYLMGITRSEIESLQ